MKKHELFNKKRGLSLVLVAALIAGLATAAGCGEDNENDVVSEAGEIASDTSAANSEYEFDSADYELIWSDEFDGDALDLSKWDYQIGDGGDYGLTNWGNNELQYYTDRPENISVADGYLSIVAQPEKDLYNGYSYTSARIRTMTQDNEALFATTFGRVEARIQMNGGSGIWPAFWMLPVDTSIYGQWAASGELDIMEEKGRTPDRFSGTAHFGQMWPNNTYSTYEYVFPEGTDASDFHVYAIDWTPTTISWYVDDVCYQTMDSWFSHKGRQSANYTNPAPFDVPFYILLNVAVGGNFDPDAILTGKSFPAEMKVDYVRVYQSVNGYEDALATANNTPDGIDYSEQKENLLDGSVVYNGAFDLGTNFLAYWNMEGINAYVNPADLTRELQILSTSEGARLYQEGLTLNEAHNFGVRFDVTTDTAFDLTIKITAPDGTVLEEHAEPVEAATKKIYAYTFENSIFCDDATFEIIFPSGTTAGIDNVMLVQID